MEPVPVAESTGQCWHLEEKESFFFFFLELTYEMFCVALSLQGYF